MYISAHCETENAVGEISISPVPAPILVDQVSVARLLVYFAINCPELGTPYLPGVIGKLPLVCPKIYTSFSLSNCTK